MQYEIKYNYQGAIGTLYMPLIAEQQLLKEDIVYSARIAVAKFLGTRAVLKNKDKHNDESESIIG